MDKRIVYTSVKTFNNSFKKEEYKKLPCCEGENNLNEGGEKTFVFNYAQMLAYLQDSMIMEIFEIKDTADTITLENDFFPAQFSSAKLLFGTEEIENITQSPGEASTIIQSIITSDTYKKNYGMLAGWSPDNTKQADKDNKGFIKRKEFYNGKKTVKIFYPLRFLFGVLNDYPKVFYEIPNITLILNRQTDDTLSKRIFFGSALKQSGTPAADVLPKIVIKKLEWHIPVLTPNLTAETFFHNQLNKDKNIEIGFMKHRMAKTTFNTEEFTWVISEVKKHIRFIFIVFKTEKDDAKVNNNAFSGNKIKKIQVAVNGENYPEMNLDYTNGDSAEAYLAYIKSCEYFGNECQMNMKEFVDLYSIFCINTTSQNETLEGNSVSITISKEGSDQITCYSLLLEEAHLKINLEDHSIKRL